MKTIITALLGGLMFIVILAASALVYARSTGLSARPTPGAIETRGARSLRRLAVPADLRGRTNPESKTVEVLDQVRAHFAKQCAICHANNGSGKTEIGGNMYPPAPDMRTGDTQDLSDGELFNIIKNGVRFTGMPGWGGEDEDNWKLVLFIRHLPKLSQIELHLMREVNDQGPEQE